jgi:hypothetical protein
MVIGLISEGSTNRPIHSLDPLPVKTGAAVMMVVMMVMIVSRRYNLCLRRIWQCDAEKENYT